mmetsp:Transcript_5408/g.15913  ORF Transcript_5408/g.15913 Transcript_5408/m.15913 type:complete len:240 (+) Transcript_5408:84-803(+)
MSPAPVSRELIETSRVTSGVTFGLPSRSPPIQDAKTTGAMSGGNGLLKSGLDSSSASRRLRKAGTDVQRDSVTMFSPCRASLMGVGFSRRISSVCHNSSICCVMSRWTLSRTRVGIDLESSSWSRAATCWCLRITVRRLTSVGCAVKTISACSWQSDSKISSAVALSDSSSDCTVPITESCMGQFSPVTSRSWSLRTRWWPSAEFARVRNCAKARATRRISDAVRSRARFTNCWNLGPP